MLLLVFVFSVLPSYFFGSHPTESGGLVREDTDVIELALAMLARDFVQHERQRDEYKNDHPRREDGALVALKR